MQPQAPQRPVMDVKIPPRPHAPVSPSPTPQPSPAQPAAQKPAEVPAPQTLPAPMPTASQPLAVHEPPKDSDEPTTPAADAAKVDQKKGSEPVKETTPKEPKPAPQRPKAPGAPLPVGAIVLAIVAMITLSVLAIAVYLQS